MQIFLSIDPFLDKPKPSAMPDWDARRRFGVFFVGVSGLLWPVLRMGRRGKLPSSIFKTVRKWLLKEPNKYGFESGSWQLNMILEMIKREFGIDCKIRTLRRKLRRIRFSWRKCRYVPYKSASKKVQEEFKQVAGEKAAEYRKEGRPAFVMRQGYRYRRTPATGGGPPTGATPSRSASQKNPSG